MPELQDIFRKYGQDYCSKQPIAPHILRAISSIDRCRTADLGGHTDTCEECGAVRISYNSCRNRHCPKCQNLPKEKWIQARSEDLLNTAYFHAVFTIPDILRPIVFQNQRELYSLMFQCTAETILELAADKKYLGAKTGLIAVLHTWGSNLTFHPHIHCIIPGGVLDRLERWKSSSKKFFLPAQVISRLFRGKFLSKLIAANLSFYGEHSCLKDFSAFKQLVNSCYEKEWVVYCKPPFGSASHVVKYLGRYTHRVAISNQRILKIENGKITFKCKDYKENGRWKTITLEADEFIRRFLMHILPIRFTKIRHYGILAGRGKKKRLKLCKQLTKTSSQLKPRPTTKELILQITEVDISKCPACGAEIFEHDGNQPDTS